MKKNENMPQASPATSISGEVTKLLLQHESMASLRSKLPISKHFLRVCGLTPHPIWRQHSEKHSDSIKK